MSKRMMILGAAAAGILSASMGSAAETPEGNKGKAPEDKTAAMGECHGINSCKGKGQCGSGTTSHQCGGRNSCKGKGWIKMSKKDCDSKKGKWETLKMDM